METIKIKNQKEFDDLPDSFKNFTEIRITGNLLLINKEINNSYISVYGFAQIKYVSMNSIIKILSDGVKILEANQQAILIFQDCKNKPLKKSKSVIVNYTHTVDFELNNFLKIFHIVKNKTKLILYKYVRNDFTDFYSGRVKYEIGSIIKCPDWDNNKKRECGGGLHLAANPQYAKYFNKDDIGRLLKCEVEIKDILVHQKPDYPFKIRAKKCKVLEEIKEEK